MPLLVELEIEGEDFDVTGDMEVVEGKPVELGYRREYSVDDGESVSFSIV